MKCGTNYISVSSDDRFENRSVYIASIASNTGRGAGLSNGLSALDGQSLAGTGALVFEGEVLQSR